MDVLVGIVVVGTIVSSAIAVVVANFFGLHDKKNKRRGDDDEDINIDITSIG